MRLFIAVVFPEDIKDALIRCGEIARRSLNGGRVTTRENLHLTLVFLGEIEEARLPGIEAAMEECPSPPLEISVGKWGRFRQRGGDVLWREIRGGNALFALQHRLTRALLRQGFEVEDRPYVPHLTMLRRAQLPAGCSVSSLPAEEELSFAAEGMWLMRSELGGGAPKYTGLRYVPFTQTETQPDRPLAKAPVL